MLYINIAPHSLVHTRHPTPSKLTPAGLHIVQVILEMAAIDSLVTARVIGDVLDSFNTTVDLMVLFNSAPIVSGMELRSPTVSDRPTVEIGGDDYRIAYTLVNYHVD